MGLKSGSRDAGLDESDDVERSDDRDENVSLTEDTTAANSAPTETSDKDTGSVSGSETSSPSRPTMDSLPYKLRREKVNEGREQVPYFLRSEIIEAEGDLQDTLEELLGESVYKSDYREAAMVVAQRNPELVAEVLREWGYDLEKS
ncbi:hypothetical protein [Halegenticoccus soli]|uniref:hypothetical protein n=1 Tax=Halegenticoccus soli TaxID=1985678 RepID=UPI0018EBB023|nr:hypothetical protein [Halegenticoccus soli]